MSEVMRAAERVAAIVVSTVVGGLLAACDPPYSPPCRVTRREQPLATEPASGAREPLGLQGIATGLTSSWIVREVDATAGEPRLVVRAFDVARLDDRGRLVDRVRVPAPLALRARAGSVEQLGVAVEEGAALVHWTETTTTTDPDGRVRKAALLQVAYDGRQAVLSPVTCERCTMRVAFAPLATETLAVVRISPEVVAEPGALGGIGGLGASQSSAVFSAYRFRRDGTIDTLDATALGLPVLADPSVGGELSQGRLAMSVEADGAVLLISGRHAWRLDRSLAPARSPVELPGADARVAFGPGEDATLVWSDTTLEEAAASDTDRAREIFVGTVPPRRSAVSARERIARGEAVAALGRGGEELGVVFQAGDRFFFASFDADGTKRGGDVPLGDAPFRAAAGSLGRMAVLASGGGRFAVVTLNGDTLSAADVICAP